MIFKFSLKFKSLFYFVTEFEGNDAASPPKIMSMKMNATLIVGKEKLTPPLSSFFQNYLEQVGQVSRGITLES